MINMHTHYTLYILFIFWEQWFRETITSLDDIVIIFNNVSHHSFMTANVCHANYIFFFFLIIPFIESNEL